MDIPTITVSYCDAVNTEGDCLTRDPTSNTSSVLCDDKNQESNDEESLSECHAFMKLHVAQLFDSNEEISISDKKTFGDYCQSHEGRKAFAKYVDNYRCRSLEVSETTFYKLAHSFALVLFECNEDDDFFPAKILMNMAFTYYHYPEGTTLHFNGNSRKPIELHGPDMKEFTSHLSGSEEESEDPMCNGNSRKVRARTTSSSDSNGNKHSLWKSANSWISKELVLWRQFVKDAPGFSRQSERKSQQNKDDELCNESTQCAQRTDIANGNVKEKDLPPGTSGDSARSERIYLYQALRYQTIWQSLRFWNAAFFDAVNTERQTYCKSGWNDLTSEEKENASETYRNVTFAHLGTFLVNMKHLGLGKETCLQFLRKQSVIGNLNKDLYQLLRTQIEMPLQPSGKF